MILKLRSQLGHDALQNLITLCVSRQAPAYRKLPLNLEGGMCLGMTYALFLTFLEERASGWLHRHCSFGVPAPLALSTKSSLLQNNVRTPS